MPGRRVESVLREPDLECPMSMPIDLRADWVIFGNAFRICFAVAALAGSFLALRLTTRLSPVKTIAAGLLTAVLSWLLIAVIPVPLGASVLVFEFLWKVAELNWWTANIQYGWLAIPALIAALLGAVIAVAVLRIFRQRVTWSAFWRTAVINVLMIGLSLYGVERMSRPPLDVWNPDTGRFAWWAGQVTLPPGYTHHARYGGDSYAGYFVSPDERLTVEFDIGGYAGHFANRKDADYFEEGMVNGARVWIAKCCSSHGTGTYAVTFPDSGCANFFLHSSKDADAAVIYSIARSFRPKPKPGAVRSRMAKPAA